MVVFDNHGKGIDALNWTCADCGWERINGARYGKGEVSDVGKGAHGGLRGKDRRYLWKNRALERPKLRMQLVTNQYCSLASSIGTFVSKTSGNW